MTELECVPFAVGHVDEGICIRIRMGPYRVLLDCGLRDPLSVLVGEEDSDAPGETPPADLVFCSHAHSDHARGLLALHRRFPDLPIYASQVTAELLPLNWLAEEVPDFCQQLDWRSPVELYPDLTVQIWPAGHLPGAASVLFSYTKDSRPYTVFYTGDFLMSNSRLVEGLPLEEVRGLKPDVLIVEGSYGTARHPKRRQQENQLADKINQAIAQGLSILMPTPILGLGQELLMLLRSHHHFTGQNIDIWVGDRVAAGCDAYLNLLPYFPSTVQNFANHQPLFWDDRIRPRVRRLHTGFSGQTDGEQMGAIAEQSTEETPCIILVDAETPLNQFCQTQQRRWLLLLPRKFGHPSSVERAVYDQIQHSDQLQEWIQAGWLMVDSYTLGDHCDGPGTAQLIHNIRPQHIIFVHGSPSHLTDLTSLEELQNRYQLHLPSADMRIELPVGDLFVQPAPPESPYEGELTELKTTVMITLPKEITQDARWRTFADTGLLEAKWQGDELVIRGLQQRELLNQDRSTASSELEQECCDNCAYYRGQRCWNQHSPLFGFRVTPEGYCPVFKSAYESTEDAI